MIVDCHTHIWDFDKHLSPEFLGDSTRAKSGGVQMDFSLDDHYAAMRPVDHAFVFAFKSTTLGVHVPNEFVADYVSRDLRRLSGFACVDPTDPDCVGELEDAVRLPGMRGLKLAPIYQAFDPLGPEADAVFSAANRLGLPIILHQGTTFVTRGPLKWAHPVLLEEIALRYPNLKMVIAHLGHPWEADTIVLIRKQPNVYADISALYYRPWQFYNAMVLAQEYGVTHKLLFGSDYPFTTPASSFEALRRVNDLVEGTRLPRTSQTALDEIIHRDTLDLLGIDPC
ncbi:amidohydrolase [Candidatus Poribacteria bacterium]|nr:amidohydrolase [Candidatus Poribacteria bacterium]